LDSTIKERRQNATKVYPRPDPVAPEPAIDTLVHILTPFEDDILQLESALLLHNLPLFAALVFFLVGFLWLSLALTHSCLSPLVYVIIVIPALHLFYLWGGVDVGRSLYAESLPRLPPDDITRVRTVKELLGWFAPIIQWGLQAMSGVYRTFVDPNVVDTVVLVIGVILLGVFARLVNPLRLLLWLVVIGLAAPAVLTKSYQVYAYLKQLQAPGVDL
jgi:hypothetical protein